MKRNILLKITSIICALISILAIVAAITTKGSGFLDLSNIARIVCIGVAVVFSIIAIVAWKYSKPKA